MFNTNPNVGVLDPFEAKTVIFYFIHRSHHKSKSGAYPQLTILRNRLNDIFPEINMKFNM